MITLRDFTMKSESLGEIRTVTVLFPPGYRRNVSYPVLFCSDGQAIHGFSRRLALSMEHERIRPLILIGAHSSAEYRAKEYVYGANDCRFEAHERFFTGELYDWSKSRITCSLARQTCGLFGVSNGGAFALSIAARHREKYGVVIAFSIPSGLDHIAESEYARRPIAKYYLSAGTREKPICRAGRALVKIFDKYGVEYTSTERCAGHDFSFWDAELPEAIRWSFAHTAHVS